MEKPHQTLAQELTDMAVIDQAMRHHAAATNEWDESVDARNTARLKEIVTETGWPKVSEVGPDAARAAWLIAQHADQEPEFQELCLSCMRRLSAGEVSVIDMAYLEDRVLVNTGRLQRYGTQFTGMGETYGPQPIEDEVNLDARRAAIGMEPFAAYAARLRQQLIGTVWE